MAQIPHASFHHGSILLVIPILHKMHILFDNEIFACLINYSKTVSTDRNNNQTALLHYLQRVVNKIREVSSNQAFTQNQMALIGRKVDATINEFFAKEHQLSMYLCDFIGDFIKIKISNQLPNRLKEAWQVLDKKQLLATAKIWNMKIYYQERAVLIENFIAAEPRPVSTLATETLFNRDEAQAVKQLEEKKHQNSLATFSL